MRSCSTRCDRSFRSELRAGEDENDRASHRLTGEEWMRWRRLQVLVDDLLA